MIALVLAASSFDFSSLSAIRRLPSSSWPTFKGLGAEESKSSKVGISGKTLSHFKMMATQRNFDFLEEPAVSTTVAEESRVQSQKRRHSSTPIMEHKRWEKAACQEVKKEFPASSITNQKSVIDQEPVAPGPQHKSILDDLRSKAGCISTALSEDEHTTVLSTGADAIDRLLPRQGLRGDAITEWVSQAPGSGAASLSLIAAGIHLKSPSGRGPLVVVSSAGQFYPPAAVALGVPTSQIIWVRPSRHADAVWAIDQALRCKSVAAVWSSLGAHLDDRDARRFQLAAEIGQTPGFFVRPIAVRGRPSFADIRFHIDNSPPSHQSTEPQDQTRLIRVTVDRCRGGTIGRSVYVQIDDQAQIHSARPQVKTQVTGTKNETSVVHLASELAHPTTPNQKQPRQNHRRRA